MFGIYGALAGFLRRQRGAIPKPVLTKLAGLAGGFIAYNVFYGFTNPNIDNAAHLGGLVMGGLTGAVLARPLAPRRDADPARPALVAAIAVALSGAITLVVPRPPDFFEFAAIETRVIGDYNAIIESAQAGTRQPAEVADDIERKILPGWRTVHPLLKTPRGAGKQQVKVFDILRRYAQAREETWTFMVAALRGDHAAFEAQKASEGDLEGIMKELEQASAGN